MKITLTHDRVETGRGEHTQRPSEKVLRGRTLSERDCRAIESRLAGIVAPPKKKGDKTDGVVEALYNFYIDQLNQPTRLYPDNPLQFARDLKQIGETPIGERGGRQQRSLRMLFSGTSSPYNQALGFKSFLEKDPGNQVISLEEYGMDISSTVTLTIRMNNGLPIRITFYVDDYYTSHDRSLVYTDMRILVNPLPSDAELGKRVSENPLRYIRYQKEQPAASVESAEGREEAAGVTKTAAPVMETRVTSAHLDALEEVIRRIYPDMAGRTVSRAQVSYIMEELDRASERTGYSSMGVVSAVRHELGHRMGHFHYREIPFPPMEYFLRFIDSFRHGVQSFNLKTAVEEGIKDVSTLIPEGTVIELDMPGDLTVENRVGPLKAIIAEAVTNALTSINRAKRTNGRLKISVKDSEPQRVLDRTNGELVSDGRLTVVISDNGVGMRPSFHSSKIFEPLPGTTGEQHGTGLPMCLSVIRSLVSGEAERGWGLIRFVQPEEGYTATLEVTLSKRNLGSY